MNTSITTAPAKTSKEDAARLALVLDSIRDIKGKNIVQIDLRNLDDRPADFFLICEGDSTTQVASIAGRIQQRMKQELGELSKTTTGTRQAQWICLDYFDIVVHVFHPETRKFYELEDLWSDGVVTEYETL